jgi:16S rRNA (uracil1498-N3)-methyltransferase
LEHLSNIELFYTPPQNISGNNLIITGEEVKHISLVLRHKQGDKIYVTDGVGKIYLSEITKIDKTKIQTGILQVKSYENKFSNITFYIPKLKNPERFEFILEKCTELGITKFIVFQAKRSVAKGGKVERWNKILLSAMKQSLQPYLPQISVISSLNEIKNLKGEMIVFEQGAENQFKDMTLKSDKKYYLVFGPEGGLDKLELSLFVPQEIYGLTANRLRTETAIVSAAVILQSIAR